MESGYFSDLLKIVCFRLQSLIARRLSEEVRTFFIDEAAEAQNLNYRVKGSNCLSRDWLYGLC